MSQQVDVLKKSLEMVDAFIEQREQELKTFSNFGIDTEPLVILYKHFRELLQEMLAAPSPREFHDQMMALSQSIAGILIIVKPASANDIINDMQAANPTMDADAFADLIKDINKNIAPQFRASEQLADDDIFVDPENDANELIDMMELGDQVKKSSGKKTKKKSDDKAKSSTKSKGSADEGSKKSKEPKKDPFSDIYDKYK
ncbi:hypothetical protein ACK8P5_26085 (plasmid) [Paenibacillus sp. EC2-1]|uniref:hypothetical protein n=1 Tax=Paenibacillus sp. EC2-1 TaxID=3388665 RepID=UPI003BEF18C4